MTYALTPAGEDAVGRLSQRYQVSESAVRALLDAVVRGRGSMAQFSHPELGGSGQWMRGGMTMVGDMFNSRLQSTVSGLCQELSELLAVDPLVAATPTVFSGPGSTWWPAELGSSPSSSGGQNDLQYAYFPRTRRLALRQGGEVRVYDTADHTISGVQQQQGSSRSLEFTSQFGTFTVDRLARVNPAAPSNPAASSPASSLPAPATSALSAPAAPATPPPATSALSAPAAPATPPPATSALSAPAAPATPPPATAAAAASTVPAAMPVAPTAVSIPKAPTSPIAGGVADIIAAIESLAGLRDKGFLSTEEFDTKKAELLARL